MCDHPNREAAMVVVTDGVWCDPCLVPIIAALNAGGVQTVASCCGHGAQPGNIALADGRQLVIWQGSEAAPPPLPRPIRSPSRPDPAHTFRSRLFGRRGHFGSSVEQDS